MLQLDLTLRDSILNPDQRRSAIYSKTFQGHMTCDGNQTTHYYRIPFHDKFSGRTLQQNNHRAISSLRVKHQDGEDRFDQALTYLYKKQPHLTTGTTPFNLIVKPSSPPRIVDEISTSAPPDMNFTPSSFQMRARILKRLPAMFDKTESRSALAQASYKRFVCRKGQFATVFRKGDKLVLKRPP